MDSRERFADRKRLEEWSQSSTGGLIKFFDFPRCIDQWLVGWHAHLAFMTGFNQLQEASPSQVWRLAAGAAAISKASGRRGWDVSHGGWNTRTVTYVTRLVVLWVDELKGLCQGLCWSLAVEATKLLVELEDFIVLSDLNFVDLAVESFKPLLNWNLPSFVVERRSEQASLAYISLAISHWWLVIFHFWYQYFACHSLIDPVCLAFTSFRSIVHNYFEMRLFLHTVADRCSPHSCYTHHGYQPEGPVSHNLNSLFVGLCAPPQHSFAMYPNCN